MSQFTLFERQPKIIDVTKGDLQFPDGSSISSNLTITEFRESELGQTYKPYTSVWDDPSFESYDFDAGIMQGRKVQVRLKFQKEQLHEVWLKFWPYNSELGLDEWTAGIEAEGKRFHDSILEEELGVPDFIDSINIAAFSGLAVPPLSYFSSWGTVSSCYEKWIVYVSRIKIAYC